LARMNAARDIGYPWNLFSRAASRQTCVLSLRLLWTYKQSKVPQASEETFLAEQKVKKRPLI
jgi:hypothetical protein